MGKSLTGLMLKQVFPRAQYLVHYCFLIYINDLSGLSSNAKLFADDTSLFSAIHNGNSSVLELNNDMADINRWTCQWKMSFIHPKKQAQEVIFSRKYQTISHPSLVLNNDNVIKPIS